MWDYECIVTNAGALGTLPTGEQMLFATEDEYRKAYEEQENEIYDGMAEAFGWDNIPEYAEY